MTLDSEITLERCVTAFAHWHSTSRLARRNLLEAWLQHYRLATEELAHLITQETGKPITLAQGEVQRGVATLQATIEAIGTFGEEAVPYDVMDGAESCRATLRRFPRGPVLAITPFNFPVNLALHKLAPALGAGCSVIWKPCPQAPRLATRLFEIFEAARRSTGAPDHVLQLAQVEPAEAEALATDVRVAVVSFTGSERVGLHLQDILRGKPLTLELGGNAAVVLDAGIDAEWAAQQLAPAAVAGAGQSCCKAQRFYVHRELWDAFVPAFVAAVKALPVGDPMDPKVRVGPLIDEAAAIRMEAALDAAVAQGAQVLLRGTRQGNLLPPAVLTGVDETNFLVCEECFSPISVMIPVGSFEEGLEKASATRFGLRASAYSRDARHLQRAATRLRAGGVLLNLPPTFRLDAAPFGGLGHSGNGLEGPRWAMETFTEARLIVEGPAR
ncbi:MAG: aldehyde dehydrogenase family protein [Holophaga sp.]|nr:aldehyde dehydrogenase family protein [Holophaga sp.]